MAFPADITLNKVTGPGTRTFTSQTQDASRVVRVDTTVTNMALAELLTLQHTVSGGKGNVNERHLVSYGRTKPDSLGVLRSMFVNATIIAPQADAFTANDYLDGVGYILQILSDNTNVAKLLRRER